MLAKPEYFSPPNEVCCWPGRCGGASAERRRHGGDAGGSVAEIHREETVARESHREEYAGGETAEEWPERKREKARKKNIEIAKRLFIAHNALPLLEATGGASGTARRRASGTARGKAASKAAGKAAGSAVGNQIKSIEMKSILVKRISLNLSSEINERGTEMECSSRGTAMANSNRSTETACSNRGTEIANSNCSTETESSNRKTAMEIGAAMDEAGVEYNWIDVAQWPERNNGYKPEVRFRIAYSQQMLFIEYYVKEANIKALYSEDKDSKPFKDSCCEFFFSPECNNNYYNMELNCIGKGTFAFRRGGRKGPKIAYGEEIMKRIFRYSTLGEAPIETSVKENGELFEWKLTVAIPLDCFTETPMEALQGKTMRANFYKCGDDMPKPHFLTWNRIELDKPDFHTPDFFGALHFE